MKTTSEIIELQRKTGMHPLDPDGVARVSTRSTWAAAIWRFDQPNHLQPRSAFTMDWTGVPPGLRSELKALAWSLFVSRPTGRALATSTAAHLAIGFTYLAEWMARQPYTSLAELTPVAAQIFCAELKGEIRRREKERKREYDLGTVQKYLLPLQYAWEQRAALAARGFTKMRQNPFGEGSAWSAGEDIATDLDGFVEPLPDEVALPIIEEAHRLIWAPAEHILEGQRVYIEARDATPERSRHHSSPKVAKAIEEFRARTELLPDNPWPKMRLRPEPDDDGDGDDGRDTFADDLEDTHGEDRKTSDSEGPEVTGSADEVSDVEPDEERQSFAAIELRRLTMDLVAACAIVLRFQTGVRQAEVLRFAPGLDEAGMPTCIETELSESGAYELSLVKGIVSKGFEEPTATRWLLASRVAGEEEVPDAVRALQVLNRLAAIWAEWSGHPLNREWLFLKIGRNSMPKTRFDIEPLRNTLLGVHMRNFIARRVDLRSLPDEARLDAYRKDGAKAINPRQWRKTYANFLFRTEPKLLPAISRQFHHTSTALTQVAYLGKDASQLGMIEGAVMERATTTIERILAGAALGGTFRKTAADGFRDLEDVVAGLSGDRRREAIRDWFVERDIRIWSTAHGKCFVGLMPLESRCHQEAGTTDWSNQTPNFATRNPRLCSGCPCFLLDEEDAPFWAGRYQENQRIWEEAVKSGMEIHYTVALERARQSEAVLKAMGLDPTKLTGERHAQDHHA